MLSKRKMVSGHSVKMMLTSSILVRQPYIKYKMFI